MLHAQVSARSPVKGSYPRIATTPLVVGAMTLALRGETRTPAQLSPPGEPTFGFVPTGREPGRASDGYNHVGEPNLRLRTVGAWQDFASAHRRRPIRTLARGRHDLAAADITASMGDTVPLRVVRRWRNERGQLALRFSVTNTSRSAIETGVLGRPMVFDNIVSDRDLDPAHARASFVDPCIGRDAGYVQVTRLFGRGSALLVLPEPTSGLEAYVPLKNPREAETATIFTDRSPRGQTSQGFYDWTVHLAGYAAREWKRPADSGTQPPAARLRRARRSWASASPSPRPFFLILQAEQLPPETRSPR